MQLFGKDVPCGCDSRRDIMFTQGEMSPTTFLLIMGVLVAVPLITWRITK